MLLAFRELQRGGGGLPKKIKIPKANLYRQVGRPCSFLKAIIPSLLMHLLWLLFRV